MAKTLTIELVTPEKVALTTTSDGVVLPAYEGEMGVWPGHEPFLVQLEAGDVRIGRGENPEHVAISGGFAEILNDKVSIFAETAEMAGEIDAERARQALEKAKHERKIGDKAGELTLAQAESALKRAQVRLKVAQIRRPRPGSRPAGQHESGR